MSKKTFPYLLLFALAALVIVMRYCRGDIDTVTKKESSTKSKANRNRGFDRTLSHIEYTRHALCRMDCRRISKNDIQDIMRTGEINYKKSDVSDRPCPTYAVQGYTDDREHVRVIFAQCDNSTKVITCYNLDIDYKCHCPGDEEKQNYR